MTAARLDNFSAGGLPVLIGSLPLRNHEKALDLILSRTPDIPLWPQLPHDPLEQMMPQFAENIPCITKENDTSLKGKIIFDTQRPGFEEEMLSFYEEYLNLEENPDQIMDSRFRLSKERGKGLYIFAELIKKQKDNEKIKAVKGQITGPFTMLTGIKDRAGRAGYFDDTVKDMVIKGISMKAAWQTRMLIDAANKPTIIFIDEPALAGLGSSAFISVSSDEIRRMINEVAGAIHRAGGLAGLHVCANTEWSTLISSDIDILSFDAYGFFERLSALKDEVDVFLNRGSIIAWGGIPTAKEDIEKENTISLTKRFNQQMETFVTPQRDMAKLLSQTLITPSCGTGSLPLELAERVLSLTQKTSMALRQQVLGVMG
jgi:methionine synthase II (cobalamin-independent)